MSDAIRPALQTLAELDQGRFMDKLAVAIHDAVNAVTTFSKPGSVTVKIDIDTLKTNVVEPVLTMQVEITTKLPKPEASKAIFFVDKDGNPTTQQQRQTGLQFGIAGADNSTERKAG